MYDEWLKIRNIWEKLYVLTGYYIEEEKNQIGKAGGKCEMNHLGTKILETERLVLRPFKETDVENMYHNWASNNIVTKLLDVADTQFL